jgi:hypothetical protein
MAATHCAIEGVTGEASVFIFSFERSGASAAR